MSNAGRAAAYIGGIVSLGLAIRFGRADGIVLGLPLLIGGIVILAQPAAATVLADRFDAWVFARRSSITDRRLRYRLHRPTLAAFYRVGQWTANVHSAPTRCGLRVTGYLYLFLIIALLAYVVLVILLLLVILVLVLLAIALGGYVATRFLEFGSSGSGWSGRTHLSSRSSGAPRPSPVWKKLAGSRLVKEGVLGDTNTGVKVNQRGQIVREGILHDKPFGIRIDQDGSVVREGLVDHPTGVSINEQGQVVTEGLVVDHPIGIKITEEGRIVREGIVAVRQTGLKIVKDE